MKEMMTNTHFRGLLAAVKELDEGLLRGDALGRLLMNSFDVAFYGALGVGLSMSSEQKREWEKANGPMVVLRLKKEILARTVVGEGHNDGCDS